MAQWKESRAERVDMTGIPETDECFVESAEEGYTWLALSMRERGTNFCVVQMQGESPTKAEAVEIAAAAYKKAKAACAVLAEASN